MDQNTIMPVQALIGESEGEPLPDGEPRKALDAADVIIAHDVNSDHTAVVLGPELLYGFDAADEVNILRVGLDFDSNQLERFLELVEQVKGKHDYEEEDY